MRNPLSLIRVDTAIARLAATIGVVFFLQSIPLQLEQLPNMDPLWSWIMVTAIVVVLLACVLASVLRRLVRVVYTSFAALYIVALVSWPFSVVDPAMAMASPSSYWLYFLLTIATTMAAVSLHVPLAVFYTIGAPLLYGVIRVTEAGGAVGPMRAVLDSVYSILLGGAILILIAVLRYAATGVDVAQQNALERYSHAVRQHATEAERVQVDSIVHDNVLATLLSASRAYTPEAKALAAVMAGNAIGFLRDAVAVAPDSDVTVQDRAIADRITETAAAMSHPIDVSFSGVGRLRVPQAVAEALCSASAQAMVNSAQHAGGETERWVELSVLDDSVIRIEVGDRGRGFDPASVPIERLGVRVSILERVSSAGGRAEITSAPGQGTRIVITWPDPDATAPPQYPAYAVESEDPA